MDVAKDFDESLHPRDDAGRFTEGSGGLSGKKVATGGKDPTTGKLSLWGKVFGKKANWKATPKKLEGYTQTGTKFDQKLTNLVNSHWPVLQALGTSDQVSPDDQWKAFKTMETPGGKTYGEVFKNYAVNDILNEVRRQGNRREVGDDPLGHDEEGGKQAGKFHFDEDDGYEGKAMTREHMKYAERQLAVEQRGLEFAKNKVAELTKSDPDGLLEGYKSAIDEHTKEIATWEKAIKKYRADLGTQFHDFRPKPGMGPRRGTDPIVRPTAGVKDLPFIRMHGDEKEIRGLAQSKLLEKQFENAKAMEDLKAKIKPLAERYHDLYEKSDTFYGPKDEIVLNDEHYQPKTSGTANEQRGDRGGPNPMELKPEWQAKYDAVLREEEKTQREMEEVGRQKHELERDLEHLQERNADAVTEYLGDIHAKCTESWISDVYTGYALKMQRAANEMGFKWAIGDKKDRTRSEKEHMEEATAKDPDAKATMDEIKAYMTKQYNLSQASLRKDGYKPGDYITLYRGMKVGEEATADRERLKARQIKAWAKGGKLTEDEADKLTRAMTGRGDIRLLGTDKMKTKPEDIPEPKIHINQRPLTSWTDKPMIATNYPGQHIITARVPIERVFSNWRLFKNTYDENEYVVLGASEVPSTIMEKTAFKRKYAEKPATPAEEAAGT